MNIGEELQCVLEVLDDHKAEQVTVLDVSATSGVCDYMVLASGQSQRHQKALAEYLCQACKRKGIDLLGSEGKDEGQWILLDFNGVVVHLMSPRTRTYYDLESLWLSV